MPKAHIFTTVVLLVSVGILLVGCPQPATPIETKVQFDYTPERGLVPLTVRFDDNSIVGAGTIQAYTWDFGDGSTGNGPSPEHQYRGPGAYTVKLTITTAEGNFSYIRENAVIVEQAGDFEEADPDTGEFNARGVSITVPPALRGQVVFGVSRDMTQISLDVFEPMVIMSDTFTISHNLTPPDLFEYDGDTGLTTPTVLSIPMVESLPVPVVNPASLQLLARLADGRTVPIPGRVEGNAFIASVLRLPDHAKYVVIYRQETTTVDTSAIEDLYDERLDAEDNWADYWRINQSATTAQQLAALQTGSMRSEGAFLRRNFTNAELVAEVGALGAMVQGLHNLLAESELNAPALVREADQKSHNLVLYNMHRQYNYDFDTVRDRAYLDTFFGHVVIDPAQLLAITIRNLRMAATGFDTEASHIAMPNELDIAQWFSPGMAFSEALMTSIYPSCQIPPFTTVGEPAFGLPPPADRTPTNEVKPINFIQGLYDGAALYLGQRAEELLARGFGRNEYALLSSSLFFPYDALVPGYSWASHEFLNYLDNDLDFEEPLALVVGTLAGISEAIEEYGDDLLVPMNFIQALLGTYIVMDEVIEEIMAEVEGPFNENLRDYYWTYLKDRAYINSDAALLRPSDSLRSAYTFNADRFVDEALVHVYFDNPVDAVSLKAGEHPALKNIMPLSGRAVALDIHSLTTELTLSFNVAEWKRDSDGYGPAIAVYKEGRTGVDLSQPAGAYRDYRIADSTGDGINDTITVRRLQEDEVDCFHRVIVLIGNLHLTEFNNVSMEAAVYSDLVTPESEVLRRYVQACDPLYEYTLTNAVYSADEQATAYLIDMVTGAWRGTNEVDRPVWEHKMAIIEPDNIREKTALLLVAGGSTSSDISPEELILLAQFARASRSVVAIVKSVPNQPLRFSDEQRSRSEDATIAYSYDKYMTGYVEGAPDPTWPTLLPMTRAAVRAMDTVQDFMAIKPGRVRDIERFVVTGASKRGWTTWLTAAADERVSAIMPMVIDVLNMEAQMEHHRRAYQGYAPNDFENHLYGGYSTAISDYVEMNVFERLGTAEGQSLLKIVDPYQYRDLLTMPKLIANSTGDQFFLPDSSQFYFYNLSGENYLHYAPNTDHSLTDTFMVDRATLETMQAFYMAHVRNMNASSIDDVVLPDYSWRRLSDESRPVPNGTATFARLEVTASVQPEEAHVWQARAPEQRDFRLQTLGPAWRSDVLMGDVDAETGQWRAVAEARIPAAGWRGFTVQMRFAGPDPLQDADFVFSTPVYVVPQDVYPEPFQE